MQRTILLRKPGSLSLLHSKPAAEQRNCGIAEINALVCEVRVNLRKHDLWPYSSLSLTLVLPRFGFYEFFEDYYTQLFENDANLNAGFNIEKFRQHQLDLHNYYRHKHGVPLMTLDSTCVSPCAVEFNKSICVYFYVCSFTRITGCLQKKRKLLKSLIVESLECPLLMSTVNMNHLTFF